MLDPQLPPHVSQSMREIDEATDRLKRAMEDYRRAKTDYEKARQRLRWNQRMGSPSRQHRPLEEHADSPSAYDV